MTKTDMSDKTNMDVQTARKYLNLNKLPTQLQKVRNWRTREDSFESVWDEIKELLENNSGLEAKTIFKHFQRENPGKFQNGQIRTLQRRIKSWRATEGPPQEVYFDQIHFPGHLCASDYTDMNELHITISGQHFKHKLYHFVLTYSNWETGTVCFSESLESLSEGFQNALWELGGVPREHRTDRLSAAVNNLNDLKEFTDKYKLILDHYNIKGQKTQPSSPHENGDIEQSNYRYKKAINQALMLRGSRNFRSREEYEIFLKAIFKQLNAGRTVKLEEETSKLKPLPARRIEDYKKFTVSVKRGSTIRINHNTYSVHSRLRGADVLVHLYADHLCVYHGQKKVEQIPRLRGEDNHYIQYRHVIDSLVRKPGAFENYKYKSDMFPTSYFRIAYDLLKEQSPGKAAKEYLNILYFAAKENEDLVNVALRSLIESEKRINFKDVEDIVKFKSIPGTPLSISIPEVDLNSYDELLELGGVL